MKGASNSRQPKWMGRNGGRGRYDRYDRNRGSGFGSWNRRDSRGSGSDGWGSGGDGWGSGRDRGAGQGWGGRPSRGDDDWDAPRRPRPSFRRDYDDRDDEGWAPPRRPAGRRPAFDEDFDFDDGPSRRGGGFSGDGDMHDFDGPRRAGH